MPSKRKKLSKEPVKEETLDYNDLKALVTEYLDINKQVKKLNSRKSEIKEALIEVAGEEGVEERKGSKSFVKTSSIDGLQVSATLSAVNKTFLSPDAISILRKKVPIRVYKKCTEKITVVRDDQLEKLIDAGEIPDEVVELLYELTTSYRITPKITEISISPEEDDLPF